jgi:hypothetical protein
MQDPGRRTGGFARHLSYANVVSTLALLFAMTGGALAASHYVITSTKQIKPSVLEKLTPKAAPAYSAGSGLVLAGHQFSLNPSAIPTIPTIPAAYPGGGCTAGSLLQSLSASGTATCDSDHVYSAASGSEALSGGQATVVHLPAGNWVVLGKAQGDDIDNGSFVCTLEAGGAEIDESEGSTSSSDSYYTTVPVLGTTTTTGSSTAVQMYCDASAGLSLSYMTVVAIPAAALN